VGPPLLSASDLSRLTKPRPKYVCLPLMGEPDTVQAMLKAGAIDLAVVTRMDYAATTKAPDSPEAWFAHFYEVVKSPATK
jgi:hypothetical protein